MKDFEETHIRVEQHEERQQEQKYKLLGKLTHKPGLTLFEFDPKARVLTKAEIIREKVAVVTLPTKEGTLKTGVRLNKETGLPFDQVVGKVKFKEGCYYFEALNEKNAYRKIDKLLD